MERRCSPPLLHFPPTLKEAQLRDAPRLKERQKSLQASGRPQSFSRMRMGAKSGAASAAGGIMNVCSSAYWPERAAWGTPSVNTSQVARGGKASRDLFASL